MNLQELNPLLTTLHQLAQTIMLAIIYYEVKK